jgi:TRAP-type C4-dicarboxylate transport system permease small subunit
VVSQVLMLYIVVLLCKGSWDQAVINLDVTAPVTGAPMAIVYAAGIVFSVLAAVIIALDLWRLLTGRLTEDELVMVQESEEAVQMKQILDQADAADAADLGSTGRRA